MYIHHLLDVDLNIENESPTDNAEGIHESGYNEICQSQINYKQVPHGLQRLKWKKWHSIERSVLFGLWKNS